VAIQIGVPLIFIIKSRKAAYKAGDLRKAGKTPKVAGSIRGLP
jgi:hypothetical protein